MEPCRLLRGCRALLALLCLTLAAALHAEPATQLRFTRLPNLVSDDPSIVAMLQDRQGFIWIGFLNGGIARYDGGGMVFYANDPARSDSLPAGRVNTFYEDKEGTLWAGTATGLARFMPATNGFQRYVIAPTPGRHQVIRKIVPDGAKGLWLATWAGLQHFDPASGAFKLYEAREGDPNAIANNNINTMALDARGGLWVATWPNGLDYLAPGSSSFRHFRVDSAEHPDAPINKVEALAMDAQQRLWIGTRRGVYRWTDGSDWSTRQAMPGMDARINNFAPARDGGMWAATMTDGVVGWSAAHDTATSHVYRPNDPYALPTNSFQSVMQDRSGMLWVGSYNAGVLVANPVSRGIVRMIPPELTEPRREPNNTTTSIAPAAGGRLWLGGLAGLTLFDPATGKADAYYRAAPGKAGSLSSDTIHSLYQQPDGPLWVGTFDGLNRLDRLDGGFSTVRFPDTDAVIATIHPGRDGTLWLGTNTSVVHYKPADGSHQVYKADQADPGRRRALQAGTLLEDSEGRLWIGSEYADGLHLLDLRSGAFRYFAHADKDPRGLLSNFITVLHQDRRGRLWAGTAKGLNQILVAADGKVSFAAFAATGTEKVFGIQSDDAGNIWFSTPAALQRLDPASGAVTRFRAADGLIDGYRVGASFRGSDGALYFGGATGVVRIDPAAVEIDKQAPLVAITDIRVGNRSLGLLPHPEGVQLSGLVTAPNTLVLPPDQTGFAIEFAALDFVDTAKNSYQYQLEGYDRQWVRADADHRSASYTNLDPGTYRFLVKAANYRGQWNDAPASFRVTILPPYWKTWWFRLLAGALVLALLVGAENLRVRSLRRSKRRLEALVAARTGELSESNAKLEALSLTDGLTGLVNRRGFDAALHSAWARATRSGEPVAVAMLDVDHFKLFNDHYGHQPGDDCLRMVAEVIATRVRRHDDLAARYGGEEFVLLAPGRIGNGFEDLVHASKIS